jgi:hypothetical protein
MAFLKREASRSSTSDTSSITRPLWRLACAAPPVSVSNGSAGPEVFYSARGQRRGHWVRDRLPVGLGPPRRLKGAGDDSHRHCRIGGAGFRAQASPCGRRRPGLRDWLEVSPFFSEKMLDVFPQGDSRGIGAVLGGMIACAAETVLVTVPGLLGEMDYPQPAVLGHLLQDPRGALKRDTVVTVGVGVADVPESRPFVVVEQ